VTKPDAIEAFNITVQVNLLRKGRRRSTGAMTVPSVTVFADDWARSGGPIPYPAPTGRQNQDGSPELVVAWAKDLDELELKIAAAVGLPAPEPIVPPVADPAAAEAEDLLAARANLATTDPLDGLAPMDAAPTG
jgi:hypothetical protein